MQTLRERLALVRERIRKAEAQCNRIPGSAQLVAVSKTCGPEAVAEAFSLGQSHFGENYLQEALGKIDSLGHLAITWHFIGQLQANKTRAVAARFDWVHSVDRYKTAKRLNDQRPENFKPLNVCLQVKLDPEAPKGGVVPEALPDLAAAVAALPALRLRGLMIIPALNLDEPARRERFSRLRGLKDSLNESGLSLDTLSMGMSADLEAAVTEGATLVRVGTAVFGPRG